MMKKVVFLLLAILAIFLSPALSLFCGITFALLLKPQFDSYTRKISKYLLQVSVVGLGFGMNLDESLRTSADGMLFTVVSVVSVMVVGVMLGKYMGIDKKLSYLISSGTAICGGSAIAAISPVIKSNPHQTSMSLAVIFTLNAIAMFVFPPIGEMLSMTQQQFGTWAAIAIHDTSSVVGAGQMYGNEALMVATTVKLTRALWIIPLSIISSFVFRSSNEGKSRVSIPWFILLFVVAMIVNTYLSLNTMFLNVVNVTSHKALSVTLFLIGSTLSIESIRSVGYRPVLLGVLLWVLISVLSLGVIMI